MDLNIIGKDFPQHTFSGPAINEMQDLDDDGLADCGCPKRQPAPDPPSLPFAATEANVDKLKEYLVKHYSTSTMNMCTH